uniref:Uncharacterized protein n=1 Tax=Oryza sativa subsp. japonica TaxID=39947 RepID=Q84ZQ0_ORYSJ|nr:hypothetical protein [Oryza sativa Japonica Group]
MRKTARAEPWTGTRTSTRAIFPSCGGGEEEEEEEEGEAYHFHGRGEGAARVSEASGGGGGGEGERGLRLYTGAVLEARALLVREIEPMGRGAPAKPRKILSGLRRRRSGRIRPELMAASGGEEEATPHRRGEAVEATAADGGGEGRKKVKPREKEERRRRGHAVGEGRRERDSNKE